MSVPGRSLRAVALGGFFLRDLVLSSLQVARAVLARGDVTRPRFVLVPLATRSEAEVALVANYITLTPGTLSVDVSPDGRSLLVHDLFAGEDSAATCAAVREGIEARVFAVTRR